MNQTNFDMIELDKNYSTTRSVIKADLQEMAELVKQSNKPEDKFETVLFLPEGEARQGEGGLRTQGYFKVGGIIPSPLTPNASPLTEDTSPLTPNPSPENKPLITVVTVVFNGEKFLEETILSVINQTYDNVEYIIIDGGSTDGTLDIIKKYEHAIDYWVSEKDKGISDAFNKGVNVAQGDYINFQGDGDGFYAPNSLEKVFQKINPQEDIFVSAMIQRISPDGQELYRSKYAENFDNKTLLFRMSMPHQGLFTHKSYFEKYGFFDVNNTFCMDYEHLLRSYKEFPKVVTKDIVLARWRADGLGNGRTLEIFKEYDKIKRDNKVTNSLVLDFVKYWTLFKYYVKKMIQK